MALYTCDTCSNQFKYKRNLKRHIVEVHLRKTKFWKCREGGCGKEFMRRSFLSRHLRTVHKFQSHRASESALFSLMEINQQKHEEQSYYDEISSEEEIFGSIQCNDAEFDDCIENFNLSKLDSEVSSDKDNMLLCNEDSNFVSLGSDNSLVSYTDNIHVSDEEERADELFTSCKDNNVDDDSLGNVKVSDDEQRIDDEYSESDDDNDDADDDLLDNVKVSDDEQRIDDEYSESDDDNDDADDDLLDNVNNSDDKQRIDGESLEIDDNEDKNDYSWDNVKQDSKMSDDDIKGNDDGTVHSDFELEDNDDNVDEYDDDDDDEDDDVDDYEDDDDDEDVDDDNEDDDVEEDNYDDYDGYDLYESVKKESGGSVSDDLNSEDVIIEGVREDDYILITDNEGECSGDELSDALQKPDRTITTKYEVYTLTLTRRINFKDGQEIYNFSKMEQDYFEFFEYNE